VAENSGSSTPGELPGVPRDVFEAAVHCLVDLRDQGKYMLFVGPRRSVKLVGDADAFRQALAERLKRDVESEELNDVLAELQRFCNIWLRVGSLGEGARDLLSTVYRKALNDADEEKKRRLQQALEEKLALAEEHLWTDAMRQRVRRLESATAACIEELEAEVISKRRVESSGEEIDQPFLRLRLRYSEGGGEEPGVLPLLGWLLGPHPALAPARLPSFEFECDESDIDFLISRLIAAKRLLLDSEKELDTEKQQ